MAAWPSTLPAPLLDGYGIEPEDQTIRTQMEVGAARVRRRTAADVDGVPVQWNFTDAQMATFRAWFRDGSSGAAGGAGWFTVSLRKGDGGTSSVTARFNGAWKSRQLPGYRWNVTATLELRAPGV